MQWCLREHGQCLQQQTCFKFTSTSCVENYACFFWMHRLVSKTSADQKTSFLQAEPMCLSKAKGDLTLSTSSLAGQIKVVREVWREKPTPLDTISEERAVPGGLCVDWTCLYLWIQTWTWSRTQWTKQGLGKRRSQSASTGTLLHFCVWMVIVIYECVCVYVVCVHVYTGL